MLRITVGETFSPPDTGTELKPIIIFNAIDGINELQLHLEKDKMIVPFLGGVMNKNGAIELRNFLNRILER